MENADTPKPQFEALTPETVAHRYNRHYRDLLSERMGEIELELKRPNDPNFAYSHSETVVLGENILRTERAATYFDEGGHFNRSTPYRPALRQELLRKTAVLYLYGRGIIQEHGEVISECIARYNALEHAMHDGETSKPQPIEERDIQEDLGKIYDDAAEYRYQNSWRGRAIGRVGLLLSRYGRKR